ncbi:MAG: MGMT family protein [Hahellaceae bacterium]|jgi:methylated-DNA-protein-cysteine methyltransferase-like protein|nr:MGMT family protein [Hahellaceae bacterium]MCP5211608.1 MGMT family protein [Hahellaceae bacterium]
MNEITTQSILMVIRDIPEGFVSTYGDVAKRAGLPGYARHVGYVLKNLPENSQLPWHRVINSQGKISFPTDTVQYREQRQRLTAEGLIFTNNRIPLRKYLWRD